MDSSLGVRHFEDPRNCLRKVEGNPKRLKHGCKRWVGGLVTDLETQHVNKDLIRCVAALASGSGTTVGKSL